MSEFPITDKTKITRLPKRGVYVQEQVYAILDEALFCTIAYVNDHQPFQIPHRLLPYRRHVVRPWLCR